MKRLLLASFVFTACLQPATKAALEATGRVTLDDAVTPLDAPPVCRESTPGTLFVDATDTQRASSHTRIQSLQKSS